MSGSKAPVHREPYIQLTRLIRSSLGSGHREVRECGAILEASWRKGATEVTSVAALG